MMNDEFFDLKSKNIKSTCLYEFIKEILEDLESNLHSETATDKKQNALYSELSSYWSYVHLHHNSKFKKLNEKQFQAESLRMLQSKLMTKIHDRFQLVKEVFNIDSGKPDAIEDHISSLHKLKESTTTENIRLMSELQDLKLEASNNLCTAALEIGKILSQHRRHVQPSLDEARFKLLTLKLEILYLKLKLILLKGRSDHLLKPEVSSKLHHIKKQLKLKEDEINRKVKEAEVILSKYSCEEDQEYKSIVHQYTECKNQLQTRQVFIQGLHKF